MKTAQRFLAVGGATLAVLGCDPERGPCETPGVACTYIGTGAFALGPDGYAPRDTPIYWSFDIEWAPDGTPYFIDWNNHMVRRITDAGTVETVIGGGPFGVGDGAEGGGDLTAPGVPGTDVDLNHPTDLQFEPSGNLLVMAWHNHKIRELDVSTGLVHVIAGSAPGFRGNGGPMAMARFNQPRSLIRATNGVLYVLDQRNFMVRAIATDGTVSTIAGRVDPTTMMPMPGFTGDGGPAIEANLAFEAGPNPEPSGGMALVENEGIPQTLYIADGLNFRIRALDLLTGIITTVVGTGENGYGGDGGPGTSARISHVRDMEIGPDGRLYFADTENHRIRAWDPAADVVETVAGTGTADPHTSGPHGDAPASADGVAPLALALSRPMGIGFAPNGSLVIADTLNSRFVMIPTEPTTPTTGPGPMNPPPTTRPCTPAAGELCTIAGYDSAGISGDRGAAWQAELYLPMDAEMGPDGDLYVVDWNNHRIRAVDVDATWDGEITTIAGTGSLGDGPVGAPLMADFNHPTNIAWDADGNLYIAAWHNSRIRRINHTSGMLEDVAGTGARAYAGDGGPATMAALDLPAGIAFDPDGNLVIVDQANQVIRRIDMAAGTISRVAGVCVTTAMCMPGETPVACPGTNKTACTMTDATACSLPCGQAYDGDDGPATEARFAMPFGQAADPSGRIAIDDEGNIYFADSRNHRIRRIDTAGMITTIAGTGMRTGDLSDGIAATAAALNNPVDVELGPDGSIFVADTMNSCVRRIDTDGMIHNVVGVCGERGFSGDGMPADESLLDRPYGIDVLDDGTLLVADTHNNRIRIVAP